MEEFRKKIRRRAHISAALCLLAPAILIALQIITKRPMDYASGVVYGAFGSLMVVAVFNVARLFSALGDEEKLKKMYIAETDERNIALGKETGSTTLEIVSPGWPLQLSPPLFSAQR